MARILGFAACALLVAVVSAQRNSNNRDSGNFGSNSNSGSSRDRNNFGSGSGSSGNNGDTSWNSRDSDAGNFGFDRGVTSSGSANMGGSRTGSSSSNRWGDADDDADDDFSNPTITPWRNGIVPYEIAPEISAGNTAALKRMFQDISDKTCVQFRARRSSDTNYALIQSGNKCSAPLGMTTGPASFPNSPNSRFGSSRGSSSGSSSGTPSNVILGKSCFTTKRVGRRIMNLLGIPHETSRPDRDQFVEINMNNLRTGYANNIKQVARSAYLPGVLDVPYDTQSITQYSDDDLAKDPNTWGIRIKGRSTRSQTLGGENYSSLDWEKIRKAYGCPSSSGSGNRGSFDSGNGNSGNFNSGSGNSGRGRGSSGSNNF